MAEDRSEAKVRVLALTGSPRKGGNTEVLVTAIAGGVVRTGGSVETVRLPDLALSPCIGCGGCAKTGRCVIVDDMQALYDKIDAARAVIIASPVYFYALSAQMKIFIDRLQALWSRKQLLVREGTWAPDACRKGYLVSVAATKGAKLFVGAQLCAEYAFDAMGLCYGGDFLVRGVEPRGAMQTMDARMKEAGLFGEALCHAAR